MILIIDNTKNLKKAYMTPKLLTLLDDLDVNYNLISKREEVNNIINKFKDKIKGAILTGGPLCLSEELTIDSINKNITILLELHNIPILGICFGFQIMSVSYGGQIESMCKEECGISNVNIIKRSILLKGLKDNFDVFQSHKDKVVDIPSSFDIIGMNNNIIQIIENKKDKRWGVQFHPEGLGDTNIIIKNFINICYNYINDE